MLWSKQILNRVSANDTGIVVPVCLFLTFELCSKSDFCHVILNFKQIDPGIVIPHMCVCARVCVRTSVYVKLDVMFMKDEKFMNYDTVSGRLSSETIVQQVRNGDPKMARQYSPSWCYSTLLGILH